MKLTCEQISNLSDVELNRAMVWLHPPSCFILDYGHKIYTVDLNSNSDKKPIDYLADYNLTMPLAYKRELEVDFHKNSTIVSDFKLNIRLEPSSQNPLRAIAEVLVMIALEAKE